MLVRADDLRWLCPKPPPLTVVLPRFHGLGQAPPHLPAACFCSVAFLLCALGLSLADGIPAAMEGAVKVAVRARPLNKRWAGFFSLSLFLVFGSRDERRCSSLIFSSGARASTRRRAVVSSCLTVQRGARSAMAGKLASTPKASLPCAASKRSSATRRYPRRAMRFGPPAAIFVVRARQRQCTLEWPCPRFADRTSVRVRRAACGRCPALLRPTSPALCSNGT